MADEVKNEESNVDEVLDGCETELEEPVPIVMETSTIYRAVKTIALLIIAVLLGLVIFSIGVMVGQDRGEAGAYKEMSEYAKVIPEYLVGPVVIEDGVVLHKGRETKVGQLLLAERTHNEPE